MRVTVYNFNGVLDALRDEIQRRGDLEQDWQAADVVVVWQDVIGVLAEMCRQAKERRKKVVVAEHGLLAINDYIPPLSRPFAGDVLMTWGEITKKWLVQKSSIPEDQIVVTGSTVFSSMGPRVPHKGKRVLFAPRHWGDDIDENLQVAEILKKYDKAYIYSKIIVGEHDPFKYPNPIMSQRTDGNHLKLCYDALKEADVVVGIGEGTFASLCYWMDIPYISVDLWKTKTLLDKEYTKEVFNSQLSTGCRLVKPKNLLETIDYELEHPESMHEFRQIFIQDYLDGGNPKQALEKQLKIIYG